MPSVSSSVFEKTTVLRRYGSDPGVDPVVAELAMFSAITRSRVVCALMPLAERSRVVQRSIANPCLSVLVDHRLEQADVFLVQVGGELVRGIRLGNLLKLLVQCDRVPVQGDFRRGRIARRRRSG